METRVPRPSGIEDVRVVPMDEDGKHHRGNESQRNQDAARFHNVSFAWVFLFYAAISSSKVHTWTIGTSSSRRTVSTLLSFPRMRRSQVRIPPGSGKERHTSEPTQFTRSGSAQVLVYGALGSWTLSLG